MTSATETATAAATRRTITGEILTRGRIAATLVALGVLWLASDGGTYGVVARSSAAIAVLWTVAAGVALGLWPARRLTKPTRLAGALLAAFAAFTLLSAWWAPSAEQVVAQFDLALLYLAIFVLVAVAATLVGPVRIGDGIAWGIVLVGALALAGRLFPHALSTGQAGSLLPDASSRLQWPLGYWNALGILLALAVPLLLRLALQAGLVAAGLAVAALPGLGAALYLTASRGAAATAFFGVLVFLLLVERRVAVAVTLAVAGSGAALAVVVLRGFPRLVDPPLSGAAPGAAGTEFALLLVVICVVTGLVFVVLQALLTGRHPSRAAERGVALAAVALTVAGTLAVHPLRRVHAFTAPPVRGKGADAVQSHLLSSAGNGRWQFWSAALDEFRAHPLAGGGAGSYEPWWAQHGSLQDFARNAHSLYLEVLAELGLVGLTLLGCVFLVGLTGGWARVRSGGVSQAALLATFVAFAVAAAVDWIWQLAAVGAVGIACLALLLARDGKERQRPGRRSRVAVAVVALVLVGAEAVPLVAQLRLDRSHAAVRRGDTAEALRAALDARAVEPWAASPYLQLALVTEQEGRLRAAHSWIEQALSRDSSNWRLWLVASRLETKQGQVKAAAASLQRATELDPRSQLFRR